MLSNLLASFTSQVIPPTTVNGKSCLSLHSRKKDYRSLTFCESSETSVSQSVRPLKWIHPNINWSAPHFQTSACFWVLSILWLPLRGTKLDPKEQCLSLPFHWPRSYRLLEVRSWVTPSHTVHTQDRPLSHSPALRVTTWGSSLPVVEGSPSQSRLVQFGSQGFQV